MLSSQEIQEKNKTLEDLIQLVIKLFNTQSLSLDTQLAKEIKQNIDIFVSLNHTQKSILIKEYVEYQIRVYSKSEFIGLFAISIIQDILRKDFTNLVYDYFISKLECTKNKKNIGLIYLVNFHISLFNEEKIKKLFSIFKNELEIEAPNNELTKVRIKTICNCFLNSKTDDYNIFFASILKKKKDLFHWPIYSSNDFKRWGELSENKQAIIFEWVLMSLNHTKNEFVVRSMEFLKYCAHKLRDDQLMQLIKPLVTLLDEKKIKTTCYNYIAYRDQGSLTFNVPELLFRKVSLYASHIADQSKNIQNPGKIYDEKHTFFSHSGLRCRKPLCDGSAISECEEKNTAHLKFN